MNKILKQIQTPYVHAQTLLSLLGDYKKPREWILRMVKNEELIRLKNGFYLVADKAPPSGTWPYEQIANLLYGPSYVSLEWALSFYGMIPERVYTVTSIVLGRDKEYATPIGSFKYWRSASNSYAVGITRKTIFDDPLSSFLMATPEKALADLVYVTCKNLTFKELQQDLLESKRIDPEAIQQLNKELLKEIANVYPSKNVKMLIDLMEKM